MLLIDYRVGSAELLTPLRKMGLPAERGDIPADIAFEGHGEGGAPVMVGIEFKKLGELVQSLRTQRLQGYQLLTMREHFQFCYLLVEGELRYDTKGYLTTRVGRRDFKRLPGTMGVSELLKRLFTLHLNGGLNILPFARIRADTLLTISTLYHTWTDKSLNEHESHIAIYQAPTLAPVSEFRAFMSRIDGISLRKSLTIEKHFGGSIRRAVNASMIEWMKIDGIGPLIAQHIQNVMEGQHEGR